eukprot:594827-Pyramimonas_sp.AAC.2
MSPSRLSTFQHCTLQSVSISPSRLSTFQHYTLQSVSMSRSRLSTFQHYTLQSVSMSPSLQSVSMSPSRLTTFQHYSPLLHASLPWWERVPIKLVRRCPLRTECRVRVRTSLCMSFFSLSCTTSE